MDPFSIICKSCAAKLKVTKESAIGQILGCPKCGTMLEIIAPDGWAPPAPKASNSDILPTDDFGGDFDDIDNILSTPTQPAQQSPQRNPAQQQRPAKQRRQQPSAQRPKQRVANQVNQAAQQQPSEPVLPNDQWTSDETKKKRSRVNRLVGFIGMLVLLGAIGAAVWFNLQKPATIANNDDPTQNANDIDGLNEGNGQGAVDAGEKEEFDPDSPLAGLNNGDPNKDDLLDDGPIGGVGQLAGVNPIGVGPTEITNEVENPPEIPMDGMVALDGGEPVGGGEFDPRKNAQLNDDQPNDNQPVVGQAPVDGVAAAITENAQPDAAKPPPKFAPGLHPIEPPPLVEPGNSAPQPLLDDKPLLGDKPLKVQPEPGKPEIDTLDDDIGELAQYLEGQGSSLIDIQDAAAAVRRRPVIGIPKYIVQRTDNKELEKLSELNLAEQLQLPLGGVIFENVPLTSALRTISKLTGIPITLDVRAIANTGGTPNPTVSEKLTEETVEQVLDKIMGDLTKTANQILLRVSTPEKLELVESTIPFPKVPGIDEAGKARFLASIQAFVEPESWHLGENPGTLKVKGDQIIAKCTPKVKHQVQRYVRKIQAAVDLLSDPNNNDAVAITQSRWKSAQATLRQNPKFTHGSRTDIDTFLSQLQKRTGATVTVDWASMLPKGWTPQTFLPGNISEPTVDEILTELTQSLGVTVIAVDHQTFFLTSYENEANFEDLEIYPVAKIVDGKLNGPLLMRQVQHILGSQKGRFVYDPKTKCIIGLAPQSVHRQVEAALDRIGEI